jgi:hypothetical protein
MQKLGISENIAPSAIEETWNQRHFLLLCYECFDLKFFDDLQEDN